MLGNQIARGRVIKGSRITYVPHPSDAYSTEAEKGTITELTLEAGSA